MFGQVPTKILVLLCCCVMVWCNLLYVPVGILGYRAFGEDVESNVLTNFGLHPKITAYSPTPTKHFIPNAWDITIARACMASTVTLSYPIFTYITRLAIVDVLSPPRRTSSIGKHEQLLPSQSAEVHGTPVAPSSFSDVLARFDWGFPMQRRFLSCTINGATAAPLTDWGTGPPPRRRDLNRQARDDHCGVPHRVLAVQHGGDLLRHLPWLYHQHHWRHGGGRRRVLLPSGDVLATVHAYPPTHHPPPHALTA
jgi:hypothetical protein